MKKTVLITGAGTGFGKAASVALARRGHYVIATTETEEQATALRLEAPDLAVEKLDITTSDVGKAAEWDVDVLINNAGVGQTGPMADVPLSLVRQLFEVNIFGTIAITQVVLRKMVARKRGRIIMMSSLAGVMVLPTYGPLSMTRFATEALGQALRDEMAPQGIDVTIINPAPYETGFVEHLQDSMNEWYNSESLTAPSKKKFEVVRNLVLGSMKDSSEVVEVLVNLTEAEETVINNFVPEGSGDEDIRRQLLIQHAYTHPG